MRFDWFPWWSRPLWPGAALTPAGVTTALAVLLSAWLASRGLQAVLTRVATDRGIGADVRYSLGRLLHYSLLGVGVVVAVQSLGVDLTSLAFLAGALGLGIGFGLQTIASNFVSGIVLLFERPIRVGDRISLGALDGVATGQINGYVQEIGLRATSVRTPDGIALIVPNSEFVNKTIVNWSLGDPRMRIRVRIGVAYGSDPERVRAVMEAVAQHDPDVLPQPAPDVRLIATSESSLDFELLAWIANPQLRGRAESSLRFALVRGFRSEGIQIPFPQREIRILEDASTAGPRGRGEPDRSPETPVP